MDDTLAAPAAEAPPTHEDDLLTTVDAQDLQDVKVPELMRLAREAGVDTNAELSRQGIIRRILAAHDQPIPAHGVLEVVRDGYGFLRGPESSYLPSDDDVYVPPQFVRDHALQSGDTIEAIVRAPRNNGERYFAVEELIEVNHALAVVGSGPASITVAADVRRAGHAVTIFEAFHKPGGVLLYGIPEFRLPKSIVHEEIETLRAMGVEIRTNFVVGRTRKLTDLLDEEGYDAIFVGTGAGLPRFLDIEGENLIGVFSANEYLTRSNLMRAFDREKADTPIFPSRHVAVIGGGNVAMDAARTALRLGAESVKLVYRRTAAEMPARKEEVEHAREEGVSFQFLTNPVRILGDDQEKVVGMECLKYELGPPDESGRRRPVPLDGSEFSLEVDTVIVAIGNDSNPLISQTTPELAIDPRGNVVVDPAGQSSIRRIFAGGDIVLGAATVILAMGEGPAARIRERLGAWQAAAARGEVGSLLAGGASVDALRLLADELL